VVVSVRSRRKDPRSSSSHFLPVQRMTSEGTFS
jgi:hypothetical protein